MKNDEMKNDIREKMHHENEAFLDDFSEMIFEESYRIIDIFPKRVSEEFAEEYTVAISYLKKEERLSNIYRDYAEIFLLLNCYYHMSCSFEEGIYETIQDADDFVSRFTDLKDPGIFKALFVKEKVMIVLDRQDTYMTVYGRNDKFDKMLKDLVLNKGYFFWEKVYI